MKLETMLDEFRNNYFADRAEGDEEWRISCIDSVKELTKCAESEDASAEDLLFVGELAAEILKDYRYAFCFVKHSTDKRASEMTNYCKEQFTNAFKLCHSETLLKETFSKMHLYAYVKRISYLFPDLEKYAEITPKEIFELNNALFSFFDCVVRSDRFRFVENSDEDFSHSGYYNSLSSIMTDICRWLVSFSDNHEAIIVCAEELIRGRLLKRGQDPTDLTSLSREGDSWLYSVVGEKYWLRSDVPSKEKGFAYLWEGVKDTLFPETGAENVAFLTDLFYKAKEIGLNDREKWIRIAQDMKRINEASNDESFDPRMITECESRALLIRS